MTRPALPTIGAAPRWTVAQAVGAWVILTAFVLGGLGAAVAGASTTASDRLARTYDGPAASRASLRSTTDVALRSRLPTPGRVRISERYCRQKRSEPSRPSTPRFATNAGAGLSRGERLAEVWRRLGNSPAASNADDALSNLNRTLETVEDELSGIPRNPNPGKAPDGRMYPAQPDNITPSNGGYVVRSRGHITTIGSDGSIQVVDATTGEVVFTQSGGG